LTAVPIDINEHRLCYDATLQRDDWPWIGNHRSLSQFTRSSAVAEKPRAQRSIFTNVITHKNMCSCPLQFYRPICLF